MGPKGPKSWGPHVPIIRNSIRVMLGLYRNYRENIGVI